jgi:hypothetical protein
MGISARQFNTNAEIKGRILRKIENASEEELQTSWASHHGGLHFVSGSSSIEYRGRSK